MEISIEFTKKKIKRIVKTLLDNYAYMYVCLCVGGVHAHTHVHAWVQ